MKKERSILPVRFVGLMLIDEPWARSRGGISTTLELTRHGVKLKRGWRRDHQKIIARLKATITNLEAQEAATSVIH